MKSILLPVILLFLLSPFAHAQKGVIESSLPTTPIVVDAIPDEWPMEWLIEPKGKFIYNICNDAENLYIRIKISDDLTQRKIGLFGLTVYLNPKGKKFGKLGVIYPIPKDLEQLKKDTPEGEVTPAQVAELKKGLLKDVEVLELIGLSKESIISPRLGLMNGIQVFIRVDDRSDWVYEAKIPFKAFRIDKAAVKVLGISFATGKLAVKTQPNNNSSTNSGYGRGYGSAYGMGGYGGYGAGGGYAGGAGGYSSTPYTEWNASTFMSVGVILK